MTRLPTHDEPNYYFQCEISLKWKIIIICLAYQGKDIVFRFIIEYTSLRDFGH
jgi:hypothetical protein